MSDKKHSGFEKARYNTIIYGTPDGNRRQNTHCIYFRKSDKHCCYNNLSCFGCSHCPDYKEKDS